MIKIREVYLDEDKSQIQKIIVKKGRKEETTFDNYPITVMANDIDYCYYEVQKKQASNKNVDDKTDGVLDKAKEKALEFKDSVVDTTKQLSSDQKMNE